MYFPTKVPQWQNRASALNSRCPSFTFPNTYRYTGFSIHFSSVCTIPAVSFWQIQHCEAENLPQCQCCLWRVIFHNLYCFLLINNSRCRISKSTKQLYRTKQKSVCLPQKHVLDKMADKQKAVLKKALFASFRTVFCCSKFISELKNVVKP